MKSTTVVFALTCGLTTMASACRKLPSPEAHASDRDEAAKQQPASPQLTETDTKKQPEQLKLVVDRDEIYLTLMSLENAEGRGYDPDRLLITIEETSDTGSGLRSSPPREIGLNEDISAGGPVAVTIVDKDTGRLLL